MQFPDEWHGENVENEIGDDVNARVGTVYLGSIEARPFGKTRDPSPEERDGCALEGHDQDELGRPDGEEGKHGPEQDAHFGVNGKDSAVEEQNRKLDKGNVDHVE